MGRADPFPIRQCSTKTDSDMDFIIYSAYMLLGLAGAFGLNLLVIVLIGRMFDRRDSKR